MPKEYFHLQILYDLLISVCNNGIAILELYEAKKELNLKERRLKRLRRELATNEHRVEAIKQIHQYYGLDRRMERIGQPIQEVSNALRQNE